MLYDIDLSIVIPCYNEASRGNFEDRLNQIIKYMYDKTEMSYELILVNDGSTDETLSIISKLQQTYTNVRVITYKENVGKSNALVKGIESATGRYTLMMDADLSIPLSNIKKFYYYLDTATQHQCIIATRVVNKKKIKARRLLSYLSHKATKLIFGIRFEDTQCGFKMFDTEKAQMIMPYIKSTRWLFDIELLIYLKALGVKTKSKKVTHKDDLESTLNSKEALKSSIHELVIILLTKGKTIKTLHRIKNKS